LHQVYSGKVEISPGLFREKGEITKEQFQKVEMSHQLNSQEKRNNIFLFERKER
jgi:hypothetical protein